MSHNDSYSPGYEAERTPSPPPLPPLPADALLALPAAVRPLPPLPPASIAARPEYIVLSLDAKSSTTSEDDVEPGSPLQPVSPLPPDDHHALSTPPPCLPTNQQRSWATLPPIHTFSALTTPGTTDSMAAHSASYGDDRDGRFVTHRPLPIRTAAALDATSHHSPRPAPSDALAEAPDNELPQPLDDSLGAHVLNTPTSADRSRAEEAPGAEGQTAQVAEASDEDEVKASGGTLTSQFDDSTIRYDTAGSDFNLRLTAIDVDAAPGEDADGDEKDRTVNSSFHYSPQPRSADDDTLHVHTTASSDLSATLGAYGTLSVPSRISDTTVPFQRTMSHVSLLSGGHDASVDRDGAAEYRYTYNPAEQGALAAEGRLSSNPLSPAYHAMHSPRSPADYAHPLAYQHMQSPTSADSSTPPYQHTVSTLGPASYSAAQQRAFSPSAPHEAAEDEKEPGSARVEPEVLAAIARLEAGEAAASDVVRVSMGEADEAAEVPPELELQRYGSGLPIHYGGAPVAVGAGVMVDDVLVDDGGEGINMRKEGEATPPLRNAASSSRAASKSKPSRSFRSGHRAKRDVVRVRWPVFTSFFVVSVVIVFLLEMQYESWNYDSLYENPMFGPHPDTLLHFGAKFTPALLLHGQHWRLIASPLLYSGAIQAIFALAIGYMYARQFEREHGWWRVFPCWLVSAVFGQLFSSLLAPQLVSVGGSAAVSGLVAGWLGDALHSWHSIDRPWYYLARHAMGTAMVFTAGVFPYGDLAGTLGSCVCGVACGLVAYAPVHRKASVRWRPGDFGPWRMTGLKKVLLGVILIAAMFAVVCGLLFARGVDEVFECENCHWVGCIDTPLWDCEVGVPKDCFGPSGQLTHISTSPYC